MRWIVDVWTRLPTDDDGATSPTVYLLDSAAALTCSSYITQKAFSWAIFISSYRLYVATASLLRFYCNWMWSHLYRLLFYWQWRELGFTKTPTTDWLLWTLCTGQSFYCTGHRHSPCQHGNRCCASNHGVRFPWCGNDRRSGSIGIHAIFPAMKKRFL